jgi:ERCC4-type nuclease
MSSIYKVITEYWCNNGDGFISIFLNLVLGGRPSQALIYFVKDLKTLAHRILTMIEVDVREHQLIQLLQQHDTPEQPQVTTSTLEIGDIILCGTIIIERKSVSDLYSSIIDGRYEEQGYRLSNLSTFHKHNIVYLIEGDISRHKQKNMLMSAIFSINYYKGFSVMRTHNIQETADYIWNTFKKIKKENRPGFYELSTTEPSPIEPVEKDYVSVVKKCKKENITENNIDEIMLCQIPGISTQSSIAIIKHLGSIRGLLQRYEEEGDTIFSEIKVVQTTGKEAKLNKTIIQNIKRFLLKKEKESAAEPLSTENEKKPI